MKKAKQHTAADAFKRIQLIADQVAAVGIALQQHEEANVEQADRSDAIGKTVDHLDRAAEEITRCMGDAVLAARIGLPGVLTMLSTMPLPLELESKGGST